ncbi:hypothetical protein A2J03_02545 [Rhodococcus sp. EPR-157]|jgi:hypothetical protein|uniref:hypothetical protein n=1 Tax=Rhodococcus sp. EPR-157 TaxID=1813677 RepID=UPI0007BB37B3|nr:hypothetical protein [Rhodococcus sp. EPR-157]KZF09414.1 hypothetical protein A2J03_02545 [Rhodococcus sp. EPR-157]
MGDYADEEQARVFVDLLGREIEDISDQIECEELRARSATARTDMPTFERHHTTALAMRSTLYELHRQLQALDVRFPRLRIRTPRPHE